MGKEKTHHVRSRRSNPEVGEPIDADLRRTGSSTPGSAAQGSQGADTLTYARYVALLIEHESLSEQDAIRRAAARYGVPEGTVREACQRSPGRGSGSCGTSVDLEGAPGRRAVWLRPSSGFPA